MSRSIITEQAVAGEMHVAPVIVDVDVSAGMQPATPNHVIAETTLLAAVLRCPGTRIILTRGADTTQHLQADTARTFAHAIVGATLPEDTTSLVTVVIMIPEMVTGIRTTTTTIMPSLPKPSAKRSCWEKNRLRTDSENSEWT